MEGSLFIIILSPQNKFLQIFGQTFMGLPIVVKEKIVQKIRQLRTDGTMDKQENSIKALKGVGEKYAKLFHGLGVDNVDELLRFFPRDYEYFASPVSINSLRQNTSASVMGCVTGSVVNKKIKTLHIANCIVKDETGTLRLTFFNMPYIKNSLQTGKWYVFKGFVKQKGPDYVMEQPVIYTKEEYEAVCGTLYPKYKIVRGLSSKIILKFVKEAFVLSGTIEDYFPEFLLKKRQLPSIEHALKMMHMPSNREEYSYARNRIAYEEFFLFLLSLQQMKKNSTLEKSHEPMIPVAETKRLIDHLPYRLTKGQSKVWEEVQEDLSSPYLMNRLIQGDVGSGKTIIAFLALLMTVCNGRQGALMAPTEVLAAQHYAGLLEYIQNFQLPMKPILLTGSMSAKEKRIAYEKIESGDANVIIGTHALIQERVVFHKLSLVVTDEQHRFGVRQREILSNKGYETHVLVMSATPIPRTLAIILYGDLHISVIDELPSNRLPIKNCVVGTDYRNKAYSFIQKEIAAGRQAYIICPMVDAGEEAFEELENVVEYTETLRSILPPAIRIEKLHGQMKPSEKNRIMTEYGNHNIDVLVSTTVIEVGINVPNATVMLVENAERFGLAQLHQLRGRVGRGKEQSYCIFMSGSDNKKTMERLEILNKTNDGFQIANEDLKLRGPGDLFGIRQSGMMDFLIADIYQDADLLIKANKDVEDFFREQNGWNTDNRIYFEEKTKDLYNTQLSL